MNVEILQQKGYDFLWIDGELVMWDIPNERKCQKKIADQAYGAVLVVGYGLGMVQKFLRMNPDVIGAELLTIEINMEVIRKCTVRYHQIYGYYIIGDFFKYKRLRREHKFDCIIGDVWSDILPEGLEQYKKFKKKAQQLLAPGGKILAWGQDYFEYLINKEK